MGRVKSSASGTSSRESRSGGTDYASASGSTSSDVKVKGLLNELHHLIHQVQVWYLPVIYYSYLMLIINKVLLGSIFEYQCCNNLL